uniref:hypothetical protein n=1 Tax=Candidatus Electronema sp. TaxID=2698783 RepID=UPI004057347F
MGFTAKARELAEKSFAEELEKKAEKSNERLEFIEEMSRLDFAVKERMRFVGKLFFNKFFIKNYTISFSYNDLSWYMHGHVMRTDLYVSIAVRIRDGRLVYSLDYLNDNVDQFKEFQAGGSAEDCSLEQMDKIFMVMIDKIARATAVAF